MIFISTFLISVCSQFGRNKRDTKRIRPKHWLFHCRKLWVPSWISEDAIKLVEFNEETGKMTIIAYTYVFLDETYEEFKADTLDRC